MYTRKKKPRWILRILEKFDKPKDLKVFPGKGAIYYISGVIVSLIFFETYVASAAILILAVGDPVSHIIGRYHGKKKLVINKKKLLEGTLAGTFAGTIAASFFVPVPIAFFGAAMAMMAEAFELGYLHLDDNFFIPLVAGAVMTALIAFL